MMKLPLLVLHDVRLYLSISQDLPVRQMERLRRPAQFCRVILALLKIQVWAFGHVLCFYKIDAICIGCIWLNLAVTTFAALH